MRAGTLDFRSGTLDIAGIRRLHLQRARDLRWQSVIERRAVGERGCGSTRQFDDVGVADLRTPQQVERRQIPRWRCAPKNTRSPLGRDLPGADAPPPQPAEFRVDGCSLALEQAPALSIDQPEL